MKSTLNNRNLSTTRIPVVFACRKCKSSITYGQRECLNCKTAVISGLPLAIAVLLGTLIWLVLELMVAGIVFVILLGLGLSNWALMGSPIPVIPLLAAFSILKSAGIYPFMPVSRRAACLKLILRIEQVAKTEATEPSFDYAMLAENWEKNNFSFENILQDNFGSFYTKENKARFLAYLICEEIDEEIKKCVQKALDDKDIRLNVASALGEIGDKRALGVLIDFLNDKVEAVRTNAASALKKITGQDFGLDYDRWLKWQQEPGSTQVTPSPPREAVVGDLILNDYLRRVHNRLARDGFNITRDKVDEFDVIVATSEIKMSRMATRFICVIMSSIDHVSKDIIERFSMVSLDYATKHNKRLPSVWQGTGVVSFALLASANVDDDARKYVEQRLKLNFTAMNMPVIFDLRSGQLYSHQGTPIWGSGYYKFLKKIIEEYFA